MTRVAGAPASAAREPIAIVGLGCRLPGGVTGPGALWELLESGTDAIVDLPAERFGIDDLYDPRGPRAGHTTTRWAGVVEGIEEIDAGFFELAPREAARLDPQQRLLLETAWEALDDAGIDPLSRQGTPTGVFVGMWLNEYESRMFADRSAIDFHMTTGTGRYAASGRLSYFFDLLGPSVTVDTACSSSLVAVHLACQSLATGETDLALAGGTNVLVEPFITVAYSQSGMMAPDGRCKFGDERADGYVRSDGAVVLVLKRLSDAVAAGDRVYAVVSGSAVTNDGRSSGFLATPGQAGQEAMLLAAYRSAGVDPRDVDYVEAHGTGTAAGDPVELAALGAVVGARRDPSSPCLVGSVKSNIGHTEGAAGAAGLAKVALALHRGVLPASLHVRTPNPTIPWDELGMQVVRGTQPWPSTGHPRRAGVSAFGITGTNAHVVVEEAPPLPPAPDDDRPGPHLLAVSAADPAALDALRSAHATLLDQADVDLGAVCAAAARRAHLPFRTAIVAGDAPAAAAALRDRLGASVDRASAARPVFVFPGQGSQWDGMARELLAVEPAFAAALLRCDAAILAEAGWSVVDVLRTEGHPRAEAIEVVQPLLFAVQVALAATWEAWGIRPAAVIGHSMGEVAAAHVAGVLDLEDAVKVICRRSALLARIAGAGAMAVVDLPAAEVEAAIAPDADELSVAVANSRRSTVVAGAPAKVDALVARMTAAEVFARHVAVDVASHSPQVDPLLPELRAALAGIRPVEGRVPFRSTVTAARLAGGDLDAAYWCDNLRRPVRFGDALEQELAAGWEAVVEISPHPVLLPAVHQVSTDSGLAAHPVASLRRGRPERETLLLGLAELYERGASPRWEAVVGPRRRHVDLPAYPWQRERHWYDRPVVSSAAGDGLLQRRVDPAGEAGVVLWDVVLDVRRQPALADHVVRGRGVLPGAATIAMVREAAERRWGATPVRVEDLVLSAAVELGDRPVSVQLRWQEHADGAASVRVHARADADDEWRLHASCRVCRAPLSAAAPPATAPPATAPPATAPGASSATDHDAAMRLRRLSYGPAFRTVRDAVAGGGRASATLVTEGGGDELAIVRLLDGALQVALDAVPDDLVSGAATLVPTGADAVELAPGIDDAPVPWTVVAAGDGAACVSVDVHDATGSCIARVRRARFAEVGRAGRLDDLVLVETWRPVELAPVEPAPVELAPVDAAAGAAARPAHWVVVGDGTLAHGLRWRLRRSGMAVSDDDPRTSRGGWPEAVRATAGGRLGVIDAREVGGLDAAASAVADRAGLVRELAGLDPPGGVRLWFVATAGRGADGTTGPAGPGVPSPPLAALVHGAARSLAAEAAAMGVTVVEVGSEHDLDALAAELVDGPFAGDAEPSVRCRDGRRWVRRLTRAERGTPRRETRPGDVHLATRSPGSLDAVRWMPSHAPDPGPADVVIRVEAVGINFIDVMKALGLYPGLAADAEIPLGAECCGEVVAVGDAVRGLAVGQRVVAVTPSYGTVSLAATHVTVPADLVTAAPAGCTVAEAASFPIAYLTAWFSLVDLGRVRPGERVLIHAAAGGVGLAALHLARALGAEVLATAGSEPKRRMLRSLGVEHVYDSRSADFVEGVRRATDGAGVDLVLNSLLGPLLVAGFDVLAPGGRFVELGKRDVHGGSPLPLDRLTANRSMQVLDLAELTARAPARVGAALADVAARIGHDLPPLPVTEHPASGAVEALRSLAAGEHVGKLALTMPIEPVAIPPTLARPGARYVVTGGTGALGIATARLLADRGATHLALLARREPVGVAAEEIDDLRRRGVDVRVAAVDVADRSSLERVLDELRRDGPPLRGVVHAAGVLDDATHASLTADQCARVLAPKVHGAWNLHLATAADELDHFVLFSSVAGVLGLAGQSNYAAANAFLDALAELRAGAGLPGLSVAWGPWRGDAGLAAGAHRGGRLAAEGLGGLVAADALDLLDELCGERPATGPAVAVAQLDATTWSRGRAAAARLLSELVVDGDAPVRTAPTGDLRAGLAAAPGGAARRAVAQSAVRDELAPVLRMSADRIDPHRPFKAMGLDSLMALELRNRLEARTGLTLSATLAWNHPTVAELADHLVARLGLPADADRVGPADAPAPAATTGAATTGATGTDEDWSALLGAELAAVERLLGEEGAAG